MVEGRTHLSGFLGGVYLYDDQAARDVTCAVEQRLACLANAQPSALAEQRGAAQLIPVHDVEQIVCMALSLFAACFAKERTLAAILDECF
ncbi:hypothetical protein [Pseudomonas sp. EA_35y_Pfl2_R5]|uniref:hypothetical protein n=1 Tax=Pseudomonas sp. EA_35y_Pfl2_R5 TaxID=3088690 RepID=UPI0030D90792